MTTLGWVYGPAQTLTRTDAPILNAWSCGQATTRFAELPGRGCGERFAVGDHACPCGHPTTAVWYHPTCLPPNRY